MVLLALAAIAGFGLLALRFAPERPGAALFLGGSAALCTSYVLALSGLALAGVQLVFWIGVAALLWKLVVARAATLGFLLSPPFCVLAATAAAHAALFAEAEYHYFDGYAQWGMLTRELLSTGELPDLAGNSRRPNAPPGLALWHALVCVPTGSGLREGAVYFAHFLLLALGVAPILDGLSWRRPHWIALLVTALLYWFATLGQGVAALLADAPLGVFFAGMLVVYLGGSRRPTDLAPLVPSLFAICLLKESGVFFAGSFALFAVVDSLRLDSGSWRTAARRLSQERAVAGGVALALLAPALAVGSWQLRIALSPETGRGANAWSTGGRVVASSDSDAERDAEVRQRFRIAFEQVPLRRLAVSERINAFNWSYFDQHRSQPGMATRGWLLAFFMATALAAVIADRRSRLTVVLPSAALLLAVFGVYELVLVRLYLTGGERGPLLSSFVRYTNTMLFPMFLVATAWFAPVLAGARRRTWQAGLLGLGLAALLYWEPPLVEPMLKPREPQPFRAAVRDPAARVAEVMAPGERVFVHLPPTRSTGRGRARMLGHALVPARATVHARISPESTAAALDHDYLWLLGPSPAMEHALRLRVGQEVGAGVLYRVEGEDPETRLRPVLENLALGGPG